MLQGLLSKSGLFQFQFSDEVCILSFNDVHKTLNDIGQAFIEELEHNLPILAQKPLKGLVIKSGKPGCFLAGVDIHLFHNLLTKEDGISASCRLNDLFFKISKLPFPVIAAIDGICLGGGLELALACHGRICSPKSTLGLPEVQLGLLPGGGGSQRLPRLIGMQAALDLILTGKRMDGEKALKVGLVDACVPSNQLVHRAVELCQKPLPSRKQKASLLEGTFLGRAFIKTRATKSVLKSTKGHYPAPLKALEVVVKGLSMPLKQGLKLESEAFGELLMTQESRALTHVFHLMVASKKNPYPSFTSVKQVGIIGAGLMGSGIATVLAQQKIASILVDNLPQSLKKGMDAIYKYFNERVKKKKLKPFEKDALVYHVTPTYEFEDLKSVSLVIEAVFEDLNVKQNILKKCEQTLQDQDFIFATNTSSIPIDSISQTACKPENVVGMHFFSPVPKMPLVEVVLGSKTSERAASRICELALQMGKQIIVVKDGPGFFTTRILAFQIAEALSLVAEGAQVEEVDQAMESFGMPVGTITLLDEVGIDVGHHIFSVLKEKFSDRFPSVPQIENIIKEGRKGRKNQKGFYLYENGKKLGVDPSIYQHFSKADKPITRKTIIDRCVFIFLNEAARCLEEGILSSENDGDLGAIFGLGFPPFLGGPFHYANQLGKLSVKETLFKLEEQYGKRFAPSTYWNRL